MSYYSKYNNKINELKNIIEKYEDELKDVRYTVDRYKKKVDNISNDSTEKYTYKNKLKNAIKKKNK
tara:strand:+ start:1982 stop:2179 length:198 start_codon:yes stop_codon:yes gene_type:complete